MATDTFYDALVTALYAARSHVACVTPYYVPDDVVQHAFVLCARRGVRTEMVMPAVSNHLLADKARRGLLPELAEAGVVFRWFGGMVHGKAMVVDDTVAYVGSPNLDMRSFFLNYEDALLLYYGPPEIAAVRGWIEALAAECPTHARAVQQAAVADRRRGETARAGALRTREPAGRRVDATGKETPIAAEVPSSESSLDWKLVALGTTTVALGISDANGFGLGGGGDVHSPATNVVLVWLNPTLRVVQDAGGHVRAVWGWSGNCFDPGCSEPWPS